MCADFLNIGQAVKELEAAEADYLHFDIMDGHFVPNFTLGPGMMKSIKRVADTPFDTHLMVNDPERHIETFVQAGSDLVVVHVEACKYPLRVINQIKQNGALAGIAINPATPLSTLDYVLDEVFMVLIMSVDPGFAGQKMIPSAIDKIEQLKQKIDAGGLDVHIQVDGNVSFENAPKMVAAGADILVAGSSSVFHKEMTIAEGMKALRECVAG